MNMDSEDHIIIDEIEVPLYKGTLVVVCCNNSAVVKNRFPDLDIDAEIFAHTYTGGNWNGKNARIVLLNPLSQVANLNSGVIAHEAYHVVSGIMSHVGVYPSFDNDEPMAYLIEWVVNNIHRVVDRFYDEHPLVSLPRCT